MKYLVKLVAATDYFSMKPMHVKLAKLDPFIAVNAIVVCTGIVKHETHPYPTNYLFAER
jgi:hypothetical protein